MKKFIKLALPVIAALSMSAEAGQIVTGPDTYLLSPSAPEDTYTFNDARKALEAINSSDASSITLYVEPSVYWLDDPDDPAIRKSPTGLPYAMEVSCDNLSIIGLSDNPEDVVFAVNRGQTQGAIGNFTMIHFMGKSLTTANMTFGNYCNVDLEYPLDPSLNRRRRRDAIVQAQIGICTDTDRMFARNCRFISRLNLCPFVGANRSLYHNCYFECTDDALTGSAVYLQCRFTFHSGKPFYSTPVTGAVFLDCDIHSLVAGGPQYLTKMPGPVTVIDTRFTSDHPIELKWTRDASPTVCYQSNVTLNGKPVTIDADRPELSVDITSLPVLMAYKTVLTDGQMVYNTPNLLGGLDNWDPLDMRQNILVAQLTFGVNMLHLPVTMTLPKQVKALKAQGEWFGLAPSFLCWGGARNVLPKDMRERTWQVPSTINVISANAVLSAESNNTLPRKVDNTIICRSDYGLAGAVKVTVEPYLKEAPQFVASPIVSNEKNVLKLDYKLTPGSDDASYITWYRSSGPDQTDSVAVRHGNGLTARTYPLSPADKGCYISATIHPRQSDTKTNQPVTVAFDKPVSQNMIGLLNRMDSKLSTSFAEIPIRKTQPGKQGHWNFDCYKPLDTAEHDWQADPDKSWYYGQGIDAATGQGLIQAVKGARLSYTPVRDGCNSMTMQLVAEPSKGPGQGFGSATGQYMDLCVKFDPVNLTGYALRIERTPDYDKAVTFTLVRYDDGAVSAISEPVATNCFRTPCNIRLEIDNHNFTVTATTDAPEAKASSPDIKPYVALSSPVEPSRHNSLMIQHTGSVGSSATLLRNLDVSWK